MELNVQVRKQTYFFKSSKVPRPKAAKLNAGVFFVTVSTLPKAGSLISRVFNNQELAQKLLAV